MAKIRIELNSAGVRQLLRGPEIVSFIEAKAADIAGRAGSSGGVFGHDVVLGKNRAHGMVWTDDVDAMFAEATARVLTRAIGGSAGLTLHTTKKGRTIFVSEKQKAHFTRGG